MVLEGIFATQAFTSTTGPLLRVTATYGTPSLNKSRVDPEQLAQSAAENILPPPLSYAGVLLGFLPLPDVPAAAVPAIPSPAKSNITTPLLANQAELAGGSKVYSHTLAPRIPLR